MMNEHIEGVSGQAREQARREGTVEWVGIEGFLDKTFAAIDRMDGNHD